jgi:hypothetical protein
MARRSQTDEYAMEATIHVQNTTGLWIVSKPSICERPDRAP